MPVKAVMRGGGVITNGVFLPLSFGAVQVGVQRTGAAPGPAGRGPRTCTTGHPSKGNLTYLLQTEIIDLLFCIIQ